MDEAMGLYIHVPFCATRCAYCHFVVDLSRGDVQSRYIEAVASEIEMWASNERTAGRRLVDSVYIGGGTPSWVDGRFIQLLLNTVRKHFSILQEAEVTIEVNPDSVSQEKIQCYRDAGVNRVSVGVQSFCDDELKRVGRTHTAGEAVQSIAALRRAGFQNISIDLLAALPGQTTSRWKENFHHIERLRPEHISLYLFDVDEDSLLGRKILAEEKKKKTMNTKGVAVGEKSVLPLPVEDEVIRIYEVARSELVRLGYEHYEISNFSRRVHPSTRESRSWRSHHNLKYWNLQPYLGLGCAAHSFIGPERWHNERSTEAYIKAIESGTLPRCEIETISAARLAEDAFIFGLRQIEGIRYSLLSRRLACDARSLFRPIIDPLVEDGWLIEEKDSLRLAARALLVSNEIFEHFLGAG